MVSCFEFYCKCKMRDKMDARIAWPMRWGGRYRYYSCGGFNTCRSSATLCVVTKGIKADCNHLVKNVHPCTFLTASFLQGKKLVPVWNNRHPCRISHTVRNIEHCIYRHGWRLFYAVAMFWHSHNIAGKTIHGCIVLTNACVGGVDFDCFLHVL